MPLLRGRRDEANTTRYRMHEKLFAIGDDFWIENEAGQRAFKVNGKALRVRDTLVLETTGNLSVSVIVGQIRSTAADLLAATGMSYDQSAGAVRDAVRAAEDEL